jgi:hypothetical protein
MPHIHSMSIFGVDRIEIRYEPDTSNYSITLSSGEFMLETTRIGVWRDSNNGRAPELIVEGQPVHTTLESAS